MKNFSFSNLLEMQPSQMWLFITDALRNPASNLIAFLLIVSAITVVMLLVIVAMLWLFAGSSDEDEYYDEVEGGPSEGPGSAADESASEATAAEEAEPVPVVVLSPEELERKARAEQRRRWIWAGVWIVAVAAVWVAGGWVTTQDRLCLSCHIQDSSHTARLEGHGDPHASVRCAACHEAPSEAARLTTLVPGRAIHFIAGFALPSRAVGYGNPVAVRTCRSCHESTLAGTFVNEVRGIRVSHAEPLDAGATCVDCHAPRPGRGTVERYTVGMEPCVRCHDAKKASADCEYCHTKDASYAMQSRTGAKARRHVKADCTGCHSLASCDKCHGIRMPHTKEFMGSEHARQAVEDIWFNGGRMCKRCHTENRRPCGRCHSGTFPQHPSPRFSQDHQVLDPYGRGCDSCHGYLAWIVSRNFCANCHDQYPRINPYQ